VFANGFRGVENCWGNLALSPFFSLSSPKGGEGRGEEADYSSSNPLAPALSPLGRGEGVGDSDKLRPKLLLAPAALTIRFRRVRNQQFVWITGANGLIGNYFVQTAPRFVPRWRVRALTRDQLDLLDFDAVRREFQKDKPQLVIHCAAVSTLADAQSNPDLARRVNVGVTELLAGLAADIPFVFFSTDLVFDGCKGNYVETDAVNPIHVYGETKAAAEEIVLRNPHHTVVRTSLNGGVSRAGNRGFNEKLRPAWQAGRGMNLFTDEFRCPIFAGETARAVWELVNQERAGLFHVAGAEKLSRWQIGQLIAARWPQLNPKITPGLAANFPGPPRALDTSLNITKVQKVLSAPLPGLGEWLAANPQEPF